MGFSDLSARVFVPQAVKYDEWAQSKELAFPDRFEAIAKNGWTDLVPARIADAQRRGAACFDRAFYVNANHFDLGFIEAQPDPQVGSVCSLTGKLHCRVQQREGVCGVSRMQVLNILFLCLSLSQADITSLVFLLQAAAWQHFLNSGIHDGRPHRFTC